MVLNRNKGEKKRKGREKKRRWVRKNGREREKDKKKSIYS